MPNSPRAVICIPTHNRAELLADSVGSLLTQTYANFSLLLVDGGSTDQTADVARSFRDSRFRYVRYPDNLGMTENWNRALALALAEPADYIGLFHSDDISSPKLLESEIAFLERNPKAGFVSPAFYFYNQDENRYSLRRARDSDCTMPALGLLDAICANGNSLITTPCVLARKAAFLKAGAFDTSFRICPDLDLWWRMLEHYDLGYIATPLYITRIHKGQVSSSAAAEKAFASQLENKRNIDQAISGLARRHPELDLNEYQRRIGHFLARVSLLAAKDALLAGNFEYAKDCSRRARQQTPNSWRLRLAATAIRLLCHRAGQVALLAAVQPLRWRRRTRSTAKPDFGAPAAKTS